MSVFLCLYSDLYSELVRFTHHKAGSLLPTKFQPQAVHKRPTARTPIEMDGQVMT